MALTLTGCEYLQQLWPHLIDDDTEPAPDVSESPSDGKHGQPFIALPGSRLLDGRNVLRIIDVHDPSRPRVEGALDDYRVGEGLFRIGHHVIYRGADSYRYEGAREDVAILSSRLPAILNVDISDTSQPTLIQKVEMRGRIPSQLLQTGTAIFSYEVILGQNDRAWLSRYELQGERLVLTGEVELPHGSAKLEASSNKILVGISNTDLDTRILVIDGTGAELRNVYETTISGDHTLPGDLMIDGDQLHVIYDIERSPIVDTFALSRDAALGKIGSCDIASPHEREASAIKWVLYSANDNAFYASSAGMDELYQYPVDADGNCPEPRYLGPSGHLPALFLPDVQRMLALHTHELRLFDTSSSTADPLLASAAVEGFYYGTDTDRPIQVFGLAQPEAAADGTAEPWLIGIPYYDEYSGVPEAYFELYTASRQTLTRRSMITEIAPVGDLFLFDRTLLTLSDLAIRTFDISDLSAPAELGALEPDPFVGGGFHFGDTVVYFRRTPQSGPPTGVDYPVELQFLRLDAIGDTPPVATIPTVESSAWAKGDDLLLELRWTVIDWQSYALRLTVQAYDISDTGQPRKAGVISVDGLTRFYGADAIGRSLLLPQPVQPQGPWSNLRVIDFRDPDHPVLVPQSLEVPGADFSYLSGELAGTKYYSSEQKQDGWYATRIDFADPEPSASAATPVPGAVQAATSTAVYTAAYSAEPSALTLSRVPWGDEVSPPSATHTWPGRSLSSLHADDGQHLYLVHVPQQDVPQGSEPHSDWTWLEVLDAQTLETVATLDIDIAGRLPIKIEGALDGRLLVSTAGALLFIDLRNPTQPRAQAAVSFESGATVLAHEGRIYVFRFHSDRSYPIDLQNLSP